MIEMDFITLEDGIEYAIVDEMMIDGTKYIYLVNEKNNYFKLRKLDINEDLLEVSDDKEKDKAMLEFMKRHRTDLVN